MTCESTALDPTAYEKAYEDFVHLRNSRNAAKLMQAAGYYYQNSAITEYAFLHCVRMVTSYFEGTRGKHQMISKG